MLWAIPPMAQKAWCTVNIRRRPPQSRPLRRRSTRRVRRPPRRVGTRSPDHDPEDGTRLLTSTVRGSPKDVPGKSPRVGPLADEQPLDVGVPLAPQPLAQRLAVQVRGVGIAGGIGKGMMAAMGGHPEDERPLAAIERGSPAPCDGRLRLEGLVGKVPVKATVAPTVVRAWNSRKRPISTRPDPGPDREPDRRHRPQRGQRDDDELRSSSCWACRILLRMVTPGSGQASGCVDMRLASSTWLRRAPGARGAASSPLSFPRRDA